MKQTASPNAFIQEMTKMEKTDTSLYEIYEELGVRELMESAACLRFIDEVLMEKEESAVADIKKIAHSAKRQAA
jgi:hypothetical protein